LQEIREQDTARIAKRVITNESHPTRSEFMNNKIHDEYATKPRAIKPIFIRAIEYLGQRQIDVRRIETKPYYLNHPGGKTDTNKPTNSYVQSQKDQEHQITRRNSKDTGRKIQRTYKNLHGRLQNRQKSWVRDDNTRPKA
jgi:hypothetical protein